jgi:4-hydroxy-tetrahydrodipicolinate synthase
MVTPFTPAGELDVGRGAALGRPSGGRRNDGLVISGTTGSRRRQRQEKDRPLRRWWRRSATGPRSSPASAPTTPRTRSTSPTRPRRPGRTGCCSSRRTTTSRRRPPAGRTSATADATGCRRYLRHPRPHRGRDRHRDPLALAEHPRIVAVGRQDSLPASAVVLARTDWRTTPAPTRSTCRCSIGATGFVSVVAHVVGARLRELLDAWAAGDVVKRAGQRRAAGRLPRLFRPGHPDKAALALAGCPAAVVPAGRRHRGADRDAEGRPGRVRRGARMTRVARGSWGRAAAAGRWPPSSRWAGSGRSAAT